MLAGAPARVEATISAPGYGNGPAGGPLLGPLPGPGFSFLDGRDGRAGQRTCGSASMRCHATVIPAAHGQVAWISGAASVDGRP